MRGVVLVVRTCGDTERLSAGNALTLTALQTGAAGDDQ